MITNIVEKGLSFDYYYGKESEQFMFFRIPKVLFTEAHFLTIKVESKVVYGILLDRMSLSMKNGWLDKYNRVYIIFTIEEIMDLLKMGKNKVIDSMNELEKIGLLEKKRQGQGKPNLLYVKNFTKLLDCEYKEEVIENEVENPEDYYETDLYDLDKTDDFEDFQIEKIDDLFDKNKEKYNINNKIVNLKDKVKKLIDYDVLVKNFGMSLIDEYYSIILDVLTSSDGILKIKNQEKKLDVVKSQFWKLNYEKVKEAIERVNNNPAKIHDTTAYIKAVLYDVSLSTNIKYENLANYDLVNMSSEEIKFLKERRINKSD